MKNKFPAFIKRFMSLMGSIAKAKSAAVKSKTRTLKARLIMLSLLKSKRVLLDSVTHKIHSILGKEIGQDDHDCDSDLIDGDQSKALVPYTPTSSHMVQNQLYDDDDDEKYPDLRHSLFEEEEEEEFDYMEGGSVIELMRNCKKEGEDFVLEDEIDQAADLFIMRFHKQMRMQKLDSFKRFKEMMERSV